MLGHGRPQNIYKDLTPFHIIGLSCLTVSIGGAVPGHAAIATCVCYRKYKAGALCEADGTFIVMCLWVKVNKKQQQQAATSNHTT